MQQLRLGVERIDGVDQQIRARFENCRQRLFGGEELQGFDPALGIDGVDAFLGHLGLGPTDGALQGE